MWYRRRVGVERQASRFVETTKLSFKTTARSMEYLLIGTEETHAPPYIETTRSSGMGGDWAWRGRLLDL